jgi:hypothetical protein
MRQTVTLGLLVLFVVALAGCGGSKSSPPPVIPGDPAPPAPTGFAASASGADVDLSWTNPAVADFLATLVVVRTGGVVNFLPTNGVTYTVGQNLGGGQTVVAVTAGTMATFADALPGTHFFAAFAYDAALQYSPAALAMAQTTQLPPQSGALSIDLGSGAVTVLTQPSGLTLSGTAVYNAMAMTLTTSLTVQNDAGRPLFNLKALVGTVNEGIPSGSTLPGTMTFYSYYGPGALDVAASESRDIVLTGVTGGLDPITIDLSFVDAPMFYGANYGGDWVMFDTSLSGEAHAFVLDDGLTTAGKQLRQGVISSDGLFVYAGEKQSPFISVIDTTTNTVAATMDLSGGGVGNVGGITRSLDGNFLFAAYNDGNHYHTGPDDSSGTPTPSNVEVIEFDRATLMETRSVTLRAVGDNADAVNAREIRLSPDGLRLAIVASNKAGIVNELWFVDVATFTVIDTDVGMAGVQPVGLPSGTALAEYLAWSGDGSRIFVGFNDYRWGAGLPADVVIVDPATFATISVPIAGGGQTSSVFAAGQTALYYASRRSSAAPLVVLDPVGMLQTPVPAASGSTQATGVIFHPDGSRYYVADYNNVSVFDTLTNTQIDADNDLGNGISDVIMPEQARAHMMVVSPY